jgi:FkbM family methyltransferase
MSNSAEPNNARTGYNQLPGANTTRSAMLRMARAPLLRTGRIFQALGWRLYRSERERTVERWVRASGDRTMRLDYDLDESSLVFDLGGYEGQWASDIFSRYQCPIWIFEPVPEYAANIRSRFRLNDKVKVFEFGLSDADKSMPLAISADSSSVFKLDGARTIDVQLVDVKRFISDHSVDRIGLMKVNIEGGEYDLLDRLLSTGLTGRIRDIQVQFHDFVPSALERVRAIQRALERTHALTYCYPFVWENWTAKNQEEAGMTSEKEISGEVKQRL